MGVGEDWSAAAELYAERAKYMTYPFAKLAVAEANNLSPLGGPKTHVLDVGCGSGAVESMLQEAFPGTRMLAVDCSEAMLKFVDSQRLPMVTTELADGTNLSPILARHPQGFSHVFSNFMNQFAPDPFKPVTEMVRATRSGGAIGLASWGRMDVPDIIESAARCIDPAWQSPGPLATKDFPESASLLERLFRDELGLVEVKCQTMSVRYDFKTPDDCLAYIFECQNPAIVKIIRNFQNFTGETTLQRLRDQIAAMFAAGAWDATALSCQGFVTVGRKPSP
ncbi:Methyltransferase type 11 [Moelleriella libera RCEF 2490]|uniref:Methyltransferase type 11 n=1 Tax=Moelleriella libera RCEF 2490 TaxID=1081109 RepID=A0A167WS02_9HYPO|nr:Methyltransferase type 11 [Moelleriella libera RCEF 2490]